MVNTSVLLGFSASLLLLAAGLAGCSGGDGGRAAESSETAPAAASSTQAPPSQTPPPSQMPAASETPAKSFSSAELSALLVQIEDAGGVPLKVMSGAELAGVVEQAKKMLSQVVVEPAECQELVLAANSAGSEGQSTAVGSSIDHATGTAAGVSFATGTDPVLLDKSVQAQALDRCRNVTVTTAGVTANVLITFVDGVGSNPGTMAYTSETTLPDGRKQSLLFAQAARNGVAVSVSGNGTGEEDAATRVGALLDQAIALLG